MDTNAVVWAWVVSILIFGAIVLLGYYTLWPLVRDGISNDKDKVWWKYVIVIAFLLLIGYVCFWPIRKLLTASFWKEEEVDDGDNFYVHHADSPIMSYLYSYLT